MNTPTPDDKPVLATTSAAKLREARITLMKRELTAEDIRDAARALGSRSTPRKRRAGAVNLAKARARLKELLALGKAVENQTGAAT